MAIKLIKLKTGEELISTIEEMAIENKPVGYFLTKPCTIKLSEYYTKNSEKDSYKVELYSWIPLSKEEKIPIPIDWVITIIEPVDTLLDMYRKDVLKEELSKIDKI